MLKIDNLSFRYPHKPEPVIENMTLDLKSGGIYGLLGPNGAGKSTLLYLIAGLLTPDRGKVYFKGIDTRKRLPETLTDIFIVPEEITLPPVTIDTYVKTTSPFYSGFSMEDFNRHMEIFDLNSLRDQKLSSLSMGQKKKVYMSFALACNTSLVLMDEPTNGLDIPGKAAFRRFIASIASDEKTIIISTHQVRDIEHLLDHVLIVDEHKLLLNTSMEEITQKLAFLLTTDSALIEKSLLSQPSIGGVQIVIANDGNLNTDINLEMLYELATNRLDIIENMFNQNNMKS